MNENPLVSICIPVYNGGEMLHMALQSCIYQTYRNIEIVVVDNASTDNTAEVAESFAARDSRVKYFRNDRTVPIMRNFYKTFHAATGEFVQHLGHDDWLSRNFVEDAVRVFQGDPQTGAVMHRLLGFVITGGKMHLNNDITYPAGRYPTDYMVRHVYNSRIGGLSFLAMMRRQDVLAIEPDLEPLYRHPLYGTKYEGAQGTDWVVLLRVLAKYSHFTFSNRSAFVKTDHFKNAGYTFGHDLSAPQGILNYRDFTRSCLESAYEECYPRRLKLMHVVIAALAVSDMAFYVLRQGFRPRAFREVFGADWKNFLAGYTAGEVVWTFAYAKYLFWKRIFERMGRQQFKLPVDLRPFFLDKDLNFKV